MKNKLLLTAALAAASLAAPVLAADATPGLRIAVPHADLNLASAAGVSRLDARLRLAIKTLCGEPRDYDLAGSNAIRRCRAEARDAVAAQRARLLVAAGADTRLAAR